MNNTRQKTLLWLAIAVIAFMVPSANSQESNRDTFTANEALSMADIIRTVAQKRTFSWQEAFGMICFATTGECNRLEKEDETKKKECAANAEAAEDAFQQAKAALSVLDKRAIEPVLAYIENEHGIRKCFEEHLPNFPLINDFGLKQIEQHPARCVAETKPDLNPLLDFLETQYRKAPFARRLRATLKAIECECVKPIMIMSQSIDCLPSFKVYARLRKLFEPSFNAVKYFSWRCRSRGIINIPFGIDETSSACKL